VNSSGRRVTIFTNAREDLAVQRWANQTGMRCASRIGQDGAQAKPPEPLSRALTLQIEVELTANDALMFNDPRMIRTIINEERAP